ncbi:MAG: EutN/CcmL family microcompartment protein [Desulfofundulus sp.]|uniref:EutN/CcmL family microcompartment protein n=1 Tax=Desulfofundulus sp. TaxID=2282750 RepID=UPI003C74ACC6
MLLGRVVDSVWSTRKDETLTGMKFMIVRLIEGSDESSGSLIVAVDTIGAGIGEKVLVVGGSSARLLPELMNKPVDAAIVGIIDEGTNE